MPHGEPAGGAGGARAAAARTRVYPEAVEGLAGITAGRVGPPLRLLAAAAVVIATVWLAAAPAARAGAAASPFVLAPGVGLYDQFGYAPAYTRNVPAFDEDGRAYIRSRTSSGSATSYVHTRDAGSWVRLDFLAALRAAYPSFVQTVGAGGLRNDGLVFDRQGRAYNPVTLQVRDGSTRNALLVSWDHCRTWKVFKLPQGTFTTERWVGHNELDGPPFLAIWRTSAPPDLPGSQTNTLYVTQPRLEGDQLVLPPLVKVTDRCLGLSRDSGGASFAVTRGETTWFVWSEIAPDGKGGTPHYIGTYDHATGTTSGRRKLATSPDRSDPHDKPGICLDTAGYLHVIAGGHGSPALYTRSLAPLTAVAGWTVPMPVLSTGWASTDRPGGPAGPPDLPGVRLRQPRHAAPGHPPVAARRGPVPRRQGVRRPGPPVVRVRRRLGRADGGRRRRLPRLRRVLPQARARRPRPPVPLVQLPGRARAEAGEGARGGARGARALAAPPGQVPRPHAAPLGRRRRVVALRRRRRPRRAGPGRARRGRARRPPPGPGPVARPSSRRPRPGAGCARCRRATSSRG